MSFLESWTWPATRHTSAALLNSARAKIVRWLVPREQSRGLCNSRISGRLDVACVVPDNSDKRQSAVCAAHREPAACRGVILSGDVLDLA
jgi:hypothetical protein